ncbi:hypothetical protein M2451_002194 [Dysgonomonas sp. PFB1-18]|uniref:SMI1/KNR4 family protein n=1 Tax=unclassified Dysgonomonas TaxID=2630389 RepID=UPI002475F115|nr:MULTISPECIES: SMI1/KNR4 family protein [unclassified Dysgonomonas]MDH6309823.1 hypothetical protein [Dysgonomonas sp. PF1-14]MDH6339367.1 hypothetical protein [Dysgonomonas sp. PF1-16]MDH6380866.1 hypothetical protein [Dysgonomonas sp. PFB1-18]MDH6397875.1 hypothetical protein [Dysgonomonas sp. PF1-23]
MSFEKEIEFLCKYEKSNDREVFSNDQIKDLENNCPNIPRGYIDFLKEIGAGTLREIQFRVYDDLFDFDDLGLDHISDLSKDIKFFGDNYSGDFAGFDLSTPKDEVVEFWHDSEELYYTNKTFQEYIRGQILMDEQGNDLRI